jgi:hypothetical protein
MPIKEQAQADRGGWHLDKKISIGHLVTTGTVAVAMIAWMLRLENQVSVHDVRIDLAEKTMASARIEEATHHAQLKAEQAAQYAELIRRLERIDSHLQGE